MSYISQHFGILILFLCGFLWQGCQSLLRVNEEDSAASPSKIMVDPGIEVTTSGAPLTNTIAGKRKASEALENRKEPVELGSFPVPARRQAAGVSTRTTTRTAPASADASMPTTYPATAALTGELRGDTVQMQGKTSTAGQSEGDQDFQRWFREFAGAVDDEEVLGLGDISDAIPTLIREGKKQGYLNRSMKIAINELGWEPICTPLHYAAAKGNPQAVAALLGEEEVKIDAQTPELGSTPLHFAAYEGNLNVTQLLVSSYKQQGKLHEIDVRDKEDSSPLQYAAGGPRGEMNREVAELLIANGVDPMQKSGRCTLVDISAILGNFAMVEYWIDEVSGTRRMADEEDKKIIKNAHKLAIKTNHPDIALILGDQYKRLSR